LHGYSPILEFFRVSPGHSGYIWVPVDIRIILGISLFFNFWF
jgi:hypothetical protein